MEMRSKDNRNWWNRNIAKRRFAVVISTSITVKQNENKKKICKGEKKVAIRNDW